MTCEGTYSNFKLFLTDAASYYIKTGNILKQVITGLKHVTHLSNALHNLAETIRSVCPLFNNYIALITSVFGKSKSARKSFTDSLKIKFLSFPVLTRWGTWLSFSEFIYLHFTDIEHYILNQNEKRFDNLKETLIRLKMKLIYYAIISAFQYILKNLKSVVYLFIIQLKSLKMLRFC